MIESIPMQTIPHTVSCLIQAETVLGGPDYDEGKARLQTWQVQKREGIPNGYFQENAYVTLHCSDR